MSEVPRPAPAGTQLHGRRRGGTAAWNKAHQLSKLLQKQRRLAELDDAVRALVLLPLEECLNDPDELPGVPRVVMSAVAEAYCHLDCVSAEGFEACEAVLRALEKAASSMRVEHASRKYRRAFSLNYKVIFPDEARRYRSDVLEAALSSHKVQEVIVNGESHQFSAAVLERGFVLHQAWADFVEVLRTSAFAEHGERASRCPNEKIDVRCLATLSGALHVLDEAWAAWENSYIMQLVYIEIAAKQPLREAIAAAKFVAALNLQTELDAAACQRIDDLFSTLARLNTIANPRGKGRGDLHGRVLRTALLWLRKDVGSAQEQAGFGARALLESVAGDLVGAFLKMLEYLEDVSLRLNEVDPSLANNLGLTERLLDLEVSWELGDRYMADTTAFSDLLQLSSTLENFRLDSPAFATMTDECDAELFMVLPRLLWLSALSPSSGGRVVLEQLMPNVSFSETVQSENRFRQLRSHYAETSEALLQWMRAVQPAVSALPTSRGHTMQDSLSAELQRAEAEGAALQRAVFEAAVAGHGAAGRQAAHDVLAKHLCLTEAPLLEAGGLDVLNQFLSTALQSFAQLEKLLRELEGWSMELQRHCPQDWNSLCAVLVKTLQEAVVLQDKEKVARAAAQRGFVV